MGRIDLTALIIAIRIFLTLVAVGLWLKFVCQSRRAITHLTELIAHMKQCRQMSFPEDELHPLLVPGREQLGKRSWVRMDLNGNLDNGVLSNLPDPEEEKTCAYFNRTGQILCNTEVRTAADLLTGQWYGHEEWIQDLISGRITPEDLEKRSASEQVEG